MKDLCKMNEDLERRFRTGMLHEEILELSEDAELFHLERREVEAEIARTICRPRAFGPDEVNPRPRGILRRKA